MSKIRLSYILACLSFLSFGSEISIPYQGDLLNRLVENLNTIHHIRTQQSAETKEQTEIVNKAEKAISHILELKGRGSLQFNLNPNPDTSHLPYDFKTHEELMNDSKNGDTEASLHLAARLIKNLWNDDFLHNREIWNSTRLIQQLLNQAVLANRKGAVFIQNILPHFGNKEYPLSNMDGYEDFTKAILSGDLVMFKFAEIFDHKDINGFCQKAIISFKEQAIGGNIPSQNVYAKLALQNPVSYSRKGLPFSGSPEELFSWRINHSRPFCFDKHLAMPWIKKLADQGDMVAMNQWLAFISHAVLDQNDISRIFLYYKTLVENFCLSPEDIQQGTLMMYSRSHMVYRLISNTYPNTDWSSLCVRYHEMAEIRGKYDLISFKLPTWVYPEKPIEGKKKFFDRSRNSGFRNSLLFHINDAFDNTIQNNPVLLAQVIELLTPYAQSGDVDSLLALSFIYMNLKDQTNTTFTQAYELAQKALNIIKNKGIPHFEPHSRLETEATLLVIQSGLNLLKTQNAQEELNKMAESLFLKLKESNNYRLGESCFFLGYMYENGFGTTPDLKKAATYYEEGAKAGNLKSMNNLALMYEEGRGVEKDTNKAIDLWEKCTQSNYCPSEAKENLKRLENKR